MIANSAVEKYRKHVRMAHGIMVQHVLLMYPTPLQYVQVLVSAVSPVTAAIINPTMAKAA
jgi:hypothetical protein